MRFEPDAGVLGCSPVFVVGVQLPEPLTGNLWTLDDFEGNPALLVSHSCYLTEETPLFIMYVKL